MVNKFTTLSDGEEAEEGGGGMRIADKAAAAKKPSAATSIRIKGRALSENAVSSLS